MRKVRSRLVFDASILVAARGSSVLLQAAVLALQARSYSVQQFGLHAVTVAVGYIVMSACEFGLSARALRLGAESRAGIERNFVRLRLLSLLPLVAGTMVAAVVLSGSRADLFIVVASSAFVAGEMAGELSMSVYLGRRRRGKASFLLLLRRSMGVLPFLLLGTQPSAANAGLALAGVAGVVSCLPIALQRTGYSEGILQTIRTGLPYWGASLVATVRRFDVLVVGAIGGPLLAGYLGAASRLSGPLSTVTSLLLQLAVPEISSTENAKVKLRKFRLLRITVVLNAVGLMCLAVFSQPITLLLLGEEYRHASNIVAAIFIFAGLSAIAQTQSVWYLATEMPGYIAFRTLTASVAGVFVLAAATHFWGTLGVSTAIVATGVMVLVAVLPKGTVQNLLLFRQTVQYRARVGGDLPTRQYTRRKVDGSFE